MSLYDELMEMVMDDSKIIICEIDFSESVSEATIGQITFNKIGVCNIIVHTREGSNIPHFHVESKAKGKEKVFDAAICINKNMYFDHGSHTDILNASQQKELNKKLSEINPITNKSYWKEIQDKFYSAIDSIEPKAETQPNYDTMTLYSSKDDKPKTEEKTKKKKGKK